MSMNSLFFFGPCLVLKPPKIHRFGPSALPGAQFADVEDAACGLEALQDGTDLIGIHHLPKKETSFSYCWYHPHRWN